MNVAVSIHPTENSQHECARVELHVEGRPEPFRLDVDGTVLLGRSVLAEGPALDFLLAAAAVYAADKAVARDTRGGAEDRWTREIHLSIPVQDQTRWQAVAEEFSTCVSFLTGDLWSLRFQQAGRSFLQPRPRKRPRSLVPLYGEAVSLFSGGLDSYIGAIDWLSEQPQGRLCLASHYDGHIAGPHADQDRTLRRLQVAHPDRVNQLQVRVGIRPAGPERSLRSRSLLFVALGLLAAASLGEHCPLLVPENGPIALNYPLTPSRRGSCSTRTTHPHFLAALRELLPKIGLTHDIVNPYELKTKGEMTAECRDRDLLRLGVTETVSCAKAGHKRHWDDRTARACGRCVPCLFRRASLHRGGLNAETYGIDVLSVARAAQPPNDDTLALLSFLRRNATRQEIKRDLACNGSLPYASLDDYTDVVLKMRDEVRGWLSAKAPAPLRTLAGIN